jgi:hypothetical protein
VASLPNPIPNNERDRVFTRDWSMRDASNATAMPYNAHNFVAAIPTVADLSGLNCIGY